MGGRKGPPGAPDGIPKLILPLLRFFFRERQKQNLGHIPMSELFKCPSFCVTRALNSSMAPQRPVLESKPLNAAYTVLRNPLSPLQLIFQPLSASSVLQLQ